MLLIGAGLLGRSLLRVLLVDPGFRMERVVTMELELPDRADKTQRITLFNDLTSKLRQIPGLEEVGATNALPLSDTMLADGWYVLMNPEPDRATNAATDRTCLERIAGL